MWFLGSMVNCRWCLMRATYSPLQATKEILVLVLFVSKSIVLPSITMVRYLLIVTYGSIIGIIGKFLFYITASKVSTLTCGLHRRSISSLQIVQGLEILETELEIAAAVCMCSIEDTGIAVRCNLMQWTHLHQKWIEQIFCLVGVLFHILYSETGNGLQPQASTFIKIILTHRT